MRYCNPPPRSTLESVVNVWYQVSMQVTSIRRNARIVDELDVTLGFANLATEMCFVKPTITAE